MLSFQLPHREFVTTQSSISGTLNLHIPKLNGKRFHFVSLTLHLRLKESIGWTRQDLVTFEIEKEDWTHTVWEKAVGLSPEDRQGVDESKEGTFVAVVKEPRAHGEGRIEIIADEWSWDWSLTLADEDPRAESFEGSMGNIWYELEAKCLFRWDEVDKDGNIQTVHPSPYVVESALETKIGNALRVPTIKKSQEGPVKKIGSLAHAFSKMRAGSKNNKTQLAGDFKIANQHEEFTKESLRMRNASGDKDQAGEGVAGHHNEHDDSTARNPGISPPGSSNSAHSSTNHPLPFLIRKNIKIYMVRPFSGTPSALPTNGVNPPPSPHSPHGFRRLKATIPGGQIQVQIQVPNVVYIPGYSKTSQLVPDSKKGGLVLRRDHRQREGAHPCLEHPANFDVTLTVQKTTQDVSRIGPGAKRQHSLDIATQALPIPTTSAAMGDVTHGHCHAPIERPDERRQYLTVGGQSPDQRRTEVRVRKVKCEFFQKEMCRIPTEGSPSRTIKLMLGPTYTYTNKEKRQEHHREFLPVHQTSNQSSNMSWDEGLSSMNSERGHHRHFGRNDSLAESDMALLFPLPPQEPVNHGTHSPAVQGDSLHGSSSSSSPRHHHSPLAGQPSPQQASRPFVVQLPVSLTSSKLRQSTTWPCPDPPSTAPKSDDFASPTIPTVAGNGLSSPGQLNLDQYEMDIRERYAYNARNYYVPHGGQSSSHITGRSRIELTHYLAIRISAELLQCEGEYGGAPEFGLDSVGRESLHQDQGFPTMTTTVATPPSVQEQQQQQQQQQHDSDVSGQNGANNSETRSQKEQSPGSNVSTEPTSATTIVTTFVGAATPSVKEMAAVQSMPISLNSAAGLSSTEMGESHDSAKSHAFGPYEQGNGYQAAPLFGMAAGDVKHRRGSGASLGTTVSVSSISSNHSNNISATHPSGGRLVTNALNALKKKASMTALNSMVSAISGGQRHGSLQQPPMPLYSSSPVSPSMLHQHMHRSSPSTVMSVQKLKDFVINVPVTIAIQDPAEEPSLGMNTHLDQHQCRERIGESLRAYPVSGPILGSVQTRPSNCSVEGLRSDSEIESKALTELSLHHRSESEISFSGEHVEDAEGADELLITEDAH
ncbi:hypothetical protein BGW38_000445 [Lunasporangiospora selenospora]|uniref:Uncharacterized protein n=1 Tax=Lunasporangiospora selenospora TaxID=979761 RepID=A0A9P6FVM9_9FUNG|nr:hypothetical protein BGW38_000445 [Lunasporangiospora selenospora]